MDLTWDDTSEQYHSSVCFGPSRSRVQSMEISLIYTIQEISKSLSKQLTKRRAVPDEEEKLYQI